MTHVLKKVIQFTGMMIVCVPMALGEIYSWIDENGKRQYSDRKPPSQQTVEQVDVKPVNTSRPVAIPKSDDDEFEQQAALDSAAQNALRQQARKWGSSHCVRRIIWNSPVDKATGSGGYSRKRAVVCKEPVPARFRPFLDNARYDKALYYGQ
ncbi:Uncharacterised protein [BD1-7 clade bacterium]|uniref:DUF4124 domain-containing protein n=1 Tax=BD1-7 clade bacterium TaxID=2029982 RepID=A0A5S9QG12_9GAMM|nr:Uncharacterised protein [BD1-7 clade bacterium]CAA0116971.1 Uncharacterised protein [BD1-7 clade bacterium]